MSIARGTLSFINYVNILVKYFEKILFLSFLFSLTIWELKKSGSENFIKTYIYHSFKIPLFTIYLIGITRNQ